MIENHAKFKVMIDKAISIAVLKARIWKRSYNNKDLKYIHNSGEYITVIGTNDDEEYISEEYPIRYLSLSNEQIITLEEAKYKASLEIKCNNCSTCSCTKTVKKKDVGVYIGLKNND